VRKLALGRVGAQERAVADFAVGKDVDDVLNLCLPLAVRFVLERSQDYRLFGNYYSIKGLLRAKQNYSLKVGIAEVIRGSALPTRSSRITGNPEVTCPEN
jgi:hypothetical protein